MTSPDPGRHREAGRSASAWEVLRRRDPAWYVAGSLVGNSGRLCIFLAQSLVVYQLTQSSAWVGLVWFLALAPVVVWSVPAGHLADRVDRERLVVAAQIVAALLGVLLAVVSALGLTNLAVQLVFTFAIGSAFAIRFPALKALVPGLVPPADLRAAVTLDSIAMNAAKLVGPVVGSTLVALASPTWAFLVGGVTAVAIAGSVKIVHFWPMQPRSATTATPGGADATAAPSLLAVLRSERTLMMLFATVAAVAVASDPAMTLGPALASKALGSSDALAGWLLGAFGFGAVIAGLTMRAGRDTRGAIIPALATMAIATAALSIVPNPAAALAAFAVAGFGYLAAHTRVTTLIHERVDDAARGRVMAAWGLAFVGTRPLAALVDGGLASVLGLRIAPLLIVVPLVATVVWWVLRPPDTTSLPVAGPTGGAELDRSPVA